MTPTPTASPSAARGFVELTPTVTALSETSARLSWTAPTGDIVEYRVVVDGTELAGLAFDKASTTGTLSGLAPGSRAAVVVKAVVADGTQAVASGAARLWTPYGAINQDSVNGYFWNHGGSSGAYVEAAYLSPNFTMTFCGYYCAQLAAVWDHLPVKGEAPTYNFQTGLQRFSEDAVIGGFHDTAQVWSDGATKVALTQTYGGHRVLFYNQLPTVPGTLPSGVLGQADFGSFTSNRGLASPTASTLSLPSGVCFNGTTFYVSDSGNNRILGWNGWPSGRGPAADFVIGQASFTQNGANPGGVSKGTFSYPGALDCTGGRLIAVDTNNNRLLIWNTAPTSNTPADVVVGQSTDSAAGANGAGGIGVGGINYPSHVITMPNGAGTALLVSEWNNNRVVQWDAIPGSDGVAFDRVYGQPTRVANGANAGTPARSLSGMAHPWALARENGSNRFWVSDWDNGRLLIFRLNFGPSALDVFDQGSGTSAEYSWGTTTLTRTAHSENFVQMGFSLDNTSGLFTVGAPKIWRTPPTDGNVPAEYLQGSTNVTSSLFSVPAPAPTSVSGGFSLVKIGNRTYWSDSHRILSKTGDFTASNAVPNVVLGAKDMFGTDVTATTLDYELDPGLLFTDGTTLYAVDGPRIVGYQGAKLTTSNQANDFVIGQSSRLTRNVNDGGIRASSLSSVASAEIAGGRLVVTDRGNHRVLIWNAAPTTTGAPADVVLGQATFSTAAIGTSLAAMNAPGGATVLNGKLLVADWGNRRILVWNQVPTVSGTPADYAYDPTRLTFSLPSWFNPKLMAPQKIQAYGGKLFMGQGDRILVVPDIF